MSHSLQHYQNSLVMMGNNMLQAIKKAFCDVLLVEGVSEEDDFFSIDGNSVAASHAAHNLGINMKLLYDFPTPPKLWAALSDKSESENIYQGSSLEINENNFCSSRYYMHELEKSLFPQFQNRPVEWPVPPGQNRLFNSFLENRT